MDRGCDHNQFWLWLSQFTITRAEAQDVSIDDIVAKTIAAINKQGPRGNDKSRGRSPGRSTTSGPSPGKFWFKPDCWWCGSDGQKRDCKEFQKMLADTGGFRPKGLKGAFDKAKDAWMNEHGRPSIQVSETTEAIDG